VRFVVSRLARLEQFNRLRWKPKRIRLEYGFLKHLPEDYTGPRHTVTVRRIPPAWRTGSDEDWYEWEDRPGPEPVSHATGSDDELVIQVRYVEGKPRG